MVHVSAKTDFCAPKVGLGHIVFERYICPSETYSCLEHISYSRNPKFDVWIHLGVPGVAYNFHLTVTLYLVSGLKSRKNRV